jgi:hypothetical protein
MLKAGRFGNGRVRRAGALDSIVIQRPGNKACASARILYRRRVRRSSGPSR